MTVTYYGHSCFLVETGGSRVLFDPFISPNPQAKDIDLATIRPDFILVSHGHEDHLFDVEHLAAASGAPVLAPYETGQYLTNRGVANVVRANVGGRFTLPFGTVRLVAAAHSSQLPDGSYGGLAAGFVVKGAEGTFYYAGDTALTGEMKLLPELYPRGIDVAFLPIGGTYTMDVADALIAARWCGARRVVGMHFNSFPGLEVDPAAARQLADGARIPLLLPTVGEQFTV